MALPPGARLDSGAAGLVPEVIEHPRVDAAGPGPALLEVLPTHVVRQRFPQLLARVEAVQPGEVGPDLALQGRVGVDEVLLAGPLEVQAVQAEFGSPWDDLLGTVSTGAPAATNRNVRKGIRSRMPRRW